MAQNYDFTSNKNKYIKLVSNIQLEDILCNCKWKKYHSLISRLTSYFNVIFEESMTIVDFHLSNKVGVIYITEEDFIKNTSYKRNIAKLRKIDFIRGMVLVEKTNETLPHFETLQKLVVISLGMIFVPVSKNLDEIVHFLKEIREQQETLSQKIDIQTKPTKLINDQIQISTLLIIPGLGEVKARMLLNEFQNLKGVFNANFKELSAVVGKVEARSIRNFLEMNISII